jgi:PAS domain-containing protein
VILRLLRATMLPHDMPAVLAALRTEADRAATWPGLLAWTHGVRSAGGVVRGVAVSAWRDFDTLLGHAGGDPDRDVSRVSTTGLVRDVETAHYELTDADESPPVLRGEALGLVLGTIRPNVEADVHEMVRRIRPTVEAAGVEALYVGRRVVEQRTQLAVVAIWRDRLSLHEFARARPAGAIDPAFRAQLDPWSFETYDCLPPDRLMIDPTGPATLVIDGERCVDATPGVEAVLGIPGELLIGHELGTLLDEPSRAALGDAAHGRLEPRRIRLRVAPWPGRLLHLTAVVDVDVPRAGLYSVTLDDEVVPVDEPAPSVVGA